MGATPEAWDPLVIVSAVPPGERRERRRLEDLARRPNAAVGTVVVPSVDTGHAGSPLHHRRPRLAGHRRRGRAGPAPALAARRRRRRSSSCCWRPTTGGTWRSTRRSSRCRPGDRRRRPPPPPRAAGPARRAGRSDAAPTRTRRALDGTAATCRPLAPPPASEPHAGSGPPRRSASGRAAGRRRGPGAGARRGHAVRVTGPDGGRARRWSRPGSGPSRRSPTWRCARSAVDREDLEISLFPDGANAAKTVYNTVSSARALLGDELFPPPDGGRYELSAGGRHRLRGVQRAGGRWPTRPRTHSRPPTCCTRRWASCGASPSPGWAAATRGSAPTGA